MADKRVDRGKIVAQLDEKEGILFVDIGLFFFVFFSFLLLSFLVPFFVLLWNTN